MSPGRVALVGAGDLGVTLAAHIAARSDLELVGFYDDTRSPGDAVAGRPVLGGLADIVPGHQAGGFDGVIIAIGYRHLRFRADLAARLRDAGVPLTSLVHPSTVADPSAVLEAGAVVFPGCVIDAGARIGANSVLNAGCIVAHDTVIGPDTFLGPGVTLAGFIAIGARCFLGVGTTVIDGLRLADECQTAGGAVVIADVPAGVLVAGVPAVAKGVAQVNR